MVVVTALAFTVLTAAPHAAEAQELINSTTALKRACEAGDHHVYVTVDVRITSGPHEEVSSGCKISLGPVANFEANQASMRFAGPFEIYSARERSVAFVNSSWKASSLGLYGDAASSFKSIASLLQATTASISISSLSESTVQVESRRTGSVNGLKAARSVSISGSGKGFVRLADTGIEGGTGVRIDLSGPDSVLDADTAELRSPRGRVNISAAAPKAVVAFKRVTLASGVGNTTISLAGSESLLKTEFTRIWSYAGTADLIASGQARLGSIELLDTTIAATRGVSVQGSHAGQKGTVKVVKSTVSGGADVILRTGMLGATEVSESSVTSGTAIRVLAGTGGACKAEKNTFQAPAQQVCPG